MKLYNRKEFLALPAGIVFAKYEPCCFDQWQIKGGTLPPNDYQDQELVTINDDLFDAHCDACMVINLLFTTRISAIQKLYMKLMIF